MPIELMANEKDKPTSEEGNQSALPVRLEQTEENRNKYDPSEVKSNVKSLIDFYESMSLPMETLKDKISSMNSKSTQIVTKRVRNLHSMLLSTKDEKETKFAISDKPEPKEELEKSKTDSNQSLDEKLKDIPNPRKKNSQVAVGEKAVEITPQSVNEETKIDSAQKNIQLTKTAVGEKAVEITPQPVNEETKIDSAQKNSQLTKTNAIQSPKTSAANEKSIDGPEEKSIEKIVDEEFSSLGKKSGSSSKVSLSSNDLLEKKMNLEERYSKLELETKEIKKDVAGIKEKLTHLNSLVHRDESE